MPRSSRDTDTRADLLFGSLLAVLIPLEVFCAFLAWHTVGNLLDYLFFFLIVVFLATGIGLYLSDYFRLALITILCGAAIILPYQLVLGARLLALQEEASRIVTYVFLEKIETGDYPQDLSDYEYKRLDLEKYIQTYQVGDEFGGFRLVYCVGSPYASHWYSPRSGWQYYAD